MLHTALARMSAGVPLRWHDVFPIEQVLRPLADTAMSYCVYLKLQQNIAAWKAVSAPEDRIGRRHDGSLLTDDPGTIRNDFDYAPRTPEESGIPPTAHIRAVNPRDDAGRRWLFARRGIPYQAEDSSGLLFLGFMASITEQFIPMVDHAIAKGDALLTGSDTNGTPFVRALDGGYFVALPKSFFANL
jgi:deferrochelatase/peroxidase EfeB